MAVTDQGSEAPGAGPSPNHYELLQIGPDASPQDLRQAFRRLSKRYHPDTTDLPQGQAEEAFRRLQQAYLILSDPARRRLYDAALQAQRDAASPAAAAARLRPPQPLPVRRALSGGEWFALLLLALAVVFSLVLGVGLAWARGAALFTAPSWWAATQQTATVLDLPSADDRPAAPQTPLYNHPLPALERWLAELGARQAAPHSCHWQLEHGGWTASIQLEVEDLSVCWHGAAGEVQRQFPYGFSRADVEAAILAGP